MKKLSSSLFGSFNSTRCIRNVSIYIKPTPNENGELSTPHGALGTQQPKSPSSRSLYFQLHTVHQEHLEKFLKISCTLKAFNSTRCIRNYHHNFFQKPFPTIELSTPHGALGTCSSCVFCGKWASVFQLHTVHQEHKNSKCNSTFSDLSTPHGALGTEDRNVVLQRWYRFQLHTVHQEPR